jgi:hypothetical protein
MTAGRHPQVASSPAKMPLVPMPLISLEGNTGFYKVGADVPDLATSLCAYGLSIRRER